MAKMRQVQTSCPHNLVSKHEAIGHRQIIGCSLIPLKVPHVWVFYAKETSVSTACHMYYIHWCHLPKNCVKGTACYACLCINDICVSTDKLVRFTSVNLQLVKLHWVPPVECLHMRYCHQHRTSLYI